MSKNGKLEAVKNNVTKTAVDQAAAGTTSVKNDEALMYLGGIGAIKSLADKLSSQTVRALEAFGESKGYEALGFATFADFLNESPYSPMKKSVYYDRLSALEAEGDGTYNLLNNLGVPLSKRKLLTDGTVQVEGDMLVVGAERIPLHDRHRVVEAIRTLADETTRQAKKIEKGTEENKKLKRERDDLKKAGSGAALSEYDAALLHLLGAYQNLLSLGDQLTDDELLAKREYTYAQLANQRLALDDLFGLAAPASNGNGKYAGLVSDSEIEQIGDNL